MLAAEYRLSALSSHHQQNGRRFLKLPPMPFLMYSWRKKSVFIDKCFFNLDHVSAVFLFWWWIKFCILPCFQCKWQWSPYKIDRVNPLSRDTDRNKNLALVLPLPYLIQHENKKNVFRGILILQALFKVAILFMQLTIFTPFVCSLWHIPIANSNY